MRQCLRRHWKTFLVIILPILLLPLPIVVDTPTAKCGYTLIIVGIFWILELLPISVTSLLPIILLPLWGVSSSAAVCSQYVKNVSFVIIGGVLISAAIERWNLHKRIALRVLLLMGTRPAMLLLGFLIVCSFLSMWNNNTATTALMVPIAHAIVNELKQSERDRKLLDAEGGGGLELEQARLVTDKPVPDTSKDASAKDSNPEAIPTSKEHDDLLKALVIGAAYASSIGGTATLTGTPPNVIVKQEADAQWPDNDLSFLSFIIFNFPTAVLMTFFCWVWLLIVFIGPRRLFFARRSEHSEQAYKDMQVVIRDKYDHLGSISWPEIMVAIHFLVLVILWMTREPEIVPGWSAFFKNRYIDDAVPALFVSFVLFIFPAKCPWKRNQPGSVQGDSETLLRWEYVQNKIPWNVVLLLGAGFALADAAEKSGLSKMIGDNLVFLLELPRFAALLSVVTITGVLTEFTSNTAIASLLLPIVAKLAIKGHIHPFYFMIPTCTATSLAFMFPVATPPNALVFTFGGIRMVDMAFAGFFMNITGFLLVAISAHAWGQAWFKLDQFPAWALVHQHLNTTIATNSTS